MIKHSAITIFISAIVIFIGTSIFVYIIMNSSSTGSPGSGGAIFGLLALYIYAFVAILFLVSLWLGWKINFIRYTVFTIILITILIIVYISIEKIIKKINYDKYIRKQNIHNEIQKINNKKINTMIVEYSSKINKVKGNAIKTELLLNEFNQKLLDTKAIKCKASNICEGSLEYKKFIWDRVFYLGLFVDEHFLNDKRISNIDIYYNKSFYSRYKKSFKKEKDFILFFNYFSKISYDKNTENSTHFNKKEQREYIKIVNNKNYAEAFLALLPLTENKISQDRIYIFQLLFQTGLNFDEQNNTHRFMEKVLKHISFYYYDDKNCSINKLKYSFITLKKSKNIDLYLDILLKQLEVECKYKNWDWVNLENDTFKEIFCYVKNKPTWLKSFKLIGQKHTPTGTKSIISQSMFKREYCND